MVKRARLEIIHDILKIINQDKNSIKYTPLLRKSNISTTRFKEYFAELLEKGLVKEMNHKNERFIILTEKGFKFLEKYKTIVNFIDEFEL